MDIRARLTLDGRIRKLYDPLKKSSPVFALALSTATNYQPNPFFQRGYRSEYSVFIPVNRQLGFYHPRIVLSVVRYCSVRKVVRYWSNSSRYLNRRDPPVREPFLAAANFLAANHALF